MLFLQQLEFQGAKVHVALLDGVQREEIVVPLLTNKKLIGVLDLDSARLNGFDRSGSRGLAEVVRVLVRSSDAPKLV
jgi:L-methionine (R)-S-oxide reductase